MVGLTSLCQHCTKRYVKGLGERFVILWISGTVLNYPLLMIWPFIEKNEPKIGTFANWDGDHMVSMIIRYGWHYQYSRQLINIYSPSQIRSVTSLMVCKLWRVAIRIRLNTINLFDLIRIIMRLRPSGILSNCGIQNMMDCVRNDKFAASCQFYIALVKLY